MRERPLSPAVSRRAILAGAGTVALTSTVRPARSAGEQVVRVWTQFDPASGRDPRERVFQKLIKSFEATTPGVRIAVEPQIWSQMTDKFFAAHRTKTAPDMMWVVAQKLPAAAHMGSLADLDALAKANGLWSAEDLADMAGPYWDFGAKDGVHFQVAHSRSVSGMLYRRDMMQEAGVDPDGITTWDEFLEAARKLTVKNAAGQVTRYGFGQAFSGIASQPSVAATVMLDRDGTLFAKDGKAAFATPAGIEGMTMQIDFIRRHGVSPTNAMSMSGEDIYDAFTAGRAAMILANAARIGRLRSTIKADTVDFLPFPSFTKGKSSPTEAQGWAVGVWSGSKLKDVTARFLAHISTKEADRMWVMEGGAVPMRRSTVAENPDFFKEPSKRYLARVAEVMQKSVWFTTEVPVGGWNEELDRAAQAVTSGTLDVKAALQRAEQNYNSANGY